LNTSQNSMKIVRSITTPRIGESSEKELIWMRIYKLP